MNSRLLGTGSYLPERVVSNAELSETVDTSDEWIIARTGIGQRHIVAAGQTTGDMAIAAAQKALQAAGIDGRAVDLVVVATTTPDNTFPATAGKVQAEIGAAGAFFDIQAVCSGFVYALSVVDALLKTGAHRTALVIGADALSRIVDWQDRNTCILFGDGAGAVVLQAEPATGAPVRGILSTHLHGAGATRDLLYVDGGAGSNQKTGFIHMEGRDVFKHAVAKLAECTLESLEANGLNVADVAGFIPHQANQRILDALAKKLEIPADKVVSTVAKHANTSAASIPLALDDAMQQGRFKAGDVLSMQAIGGGLAWGSALIRL